MKNKNSLNTKRRHPKNVEKKLRKTTERIPVTDDFKLFVEIILSIYQNVDEKEIHIRKDEVVDTFCDRVKIYKRFITDCVSIITKTHILVLTPYRDGIYLHLIKVSPFFRNSGIGNSIMKMMRDISNDLEVPIYLVPVPLKGDSVGYSTLQKFYSNHGYRRESDSRYWKYEPNSISVFQDKELRKVS